MDSSVMSSPLQLHNRPICSGPAFWASSCLLGVSPRLMLELVVPSSDCEVCPSMPADVKPEAMDPNRESLLCLQEIERELQLSRRAKLWYKPKSPQASKKWHHRSSLLFLHVTVKDRGCPINPFIYNHFGNGAHTLTVSFMSVFFGGGVKKNLGCLQLRQFNRCHYLFGRNITSHFYLCKSYL